MPHACPLPDPQSTPSPYTVLPIVSRAGR